MKVKTIVCAASLVFGLMAVSTAAAAAEAPAPDPFLDQMQGRWKVTGTYNGHPAKHNFKAEWQFQNGYLRFRDVSEEENSKGTEEFEVIAYIGYDAAKARYLCVWLDNNGTADPDTVAATAARSGDSLPFVFKAKDGTFHSTFVFDAKAKAWTWNMDKEKDGAIQPLARLILKRH